MTQLNPITLEALQVLDTIARRGSYALAAEELGKVPSALSYVIQQLEEKLGVTLFTRQGRKAVLTPAGQHLLTQGRSVLQAVKQLEESTRTIASGWETRLRIAIDSIIMDSEIFSIFNSFVQRHPEIEIDIREEVMSGSWESLLNDEVDLLVGAGGPVPQHKGIRAEAIAQLERVFAVSRSHPLAQSRHPISLQRLAQELTVVVHDSARQAIPWTRGLLTETRYFYVPTVQCKILAQLAGIGVGHLPRHRIQHYLDSGALIELPLEQRESFGDPQLYLAWKVVNRGKGLGVLRQLFLEHFNSDQTLAS